MIADFIARNGVTHCPTAVSVATTVTPDPADAAALRAYDESTYEAWKTTFGHRATSKRRRIAAAQAKSARARSKP